MKPQALGAMAGALAWLGATSAHAQTFGHDAYRGRYESPQNFALELRFGPYVASIDSEFTNGQHPYMDIFGAPTSYAANDPRIIAMMEFDWEAVRLGPVASLGPGIGLGFTAASAPAPFTMNVNNGPPSGWGARSTENTTLNVVPITAVASLRFDGIWRALRFPIVPYAKFGLAYGFWWVMKGSNLSRVDPADPNSQQVIGGSLGWIGTLGLAVVLDWFEPHVARELDTNQGVNHSYVFAEVYDMDLSGFLGRPQLNVGTMQWALGLAVEF